MSAAPQAITVLIDVVITLHTPLSVGAAGSSGGLADKPLVRDGWNRPMIPGSQIKGRLRHMAEQTLRALEQPICRAPVANTMCPKYVGQPPVMAQATEEFHRYRAFQDQIEPRQCLACAIFGSPVYPSPLFFGDAVYYPPNQVDGRPFAIEEHVRPGIGIDRRRGVVQDNALYFVETTEPGIVLNGAISGQWRDTTPERVRGLVGLLVVALEGVTRWGGGSSRGLGWATTRATVHIAGQHFSRDMLLQEVQRLCAIAS
ncbi:MAG: hypothetical protein H0X37_23360 [Herpetosiphonaceae bacterium]|nr:hypothetical protein [Herpetosiphonaceae bacterium]